MKPLSELMWFITTFHTPRIQCTKKSSLRTAYVIAYDTWTLGHVARDRTIFHLISQSTTNVTQYSPDYYGCDPYTDSCNDKEFR